MARDCWMQRRPQAWASFVLVVRRDGSLPGYTPELHVGTSDRAGSSQLVLHSI